MRCGYQHVLHHCNHPPCCNPACLYEGDYILNAQDAVAAGSAREGARKRYAMQPHGPAAKITESIAAEIRGLYATGQHTQAVLAARYDIHQSNVSLIVRGRTWPPS